jgi:phenylalanyl-tRNA synthetase beta chain
MVCGLLSGPRFVESWHGGGEAFDFFDAKGVVEGLTSRLGVEVSFEPCRDESLHPAKQAAIVIENNGLGVVGELHPKVVEAFELSGAVYLFEINLSALLPFTIGHKLYQPIPRFPTVVRDVALVVEAGVTNGKAQDIIKDFPLVSQVALFDVYSGGQLPVGKKSLAYRITFQSPSHTLTDEEVGKVQQQILDKLSAELGATLRG